MSPSREGLIADMTHVLETAGLCKEFGGFWVVSDVSLKVRESDIHALIGPNGAGKTTVFNLLTQFLQPTSGTIVLDGRDLTGEKSAALARQGMVRSFQISATFPDLTVLENVRVALPRRSAPTYASWLPGWVLDRLNARAMELLELVDMQDSRRHGPPICPMGASVPSRSRGRWRWSRGSCCSTTRPRAWGMKTWSG